MSHFFLKCHQYTSTASFGSKNPYYSQTVEGICWTFYGFLKVIAIFTGFVNKNAEESGMLAMSE